MREPSRLPARRRLPFVSRSPGPGPGTLPQPLPPRQAARAARASQGEGERAGAGRRRPDRASARACGVRGSRCPPPSPSHLSSPPPRSPPRPRNSTMSAPAAKVSKKELNSNHDGADETSGEEQARRGPARAAIFAARPARRPPAGPEACWGRRADGPARVSAPFFVRAGPGPGWRRGGGGGGGRRCGLFGAGGGDPPFLSPLPRSPPPPSLPRSLSLLCSAMMPRSHQPPPPPHGAAGRGPAPGPPRGCPFAPGPRAAPPCPHPEAGPRASLGLELGQGGGAGKHAARGALGPGRPRRMLGAPRALPTWGGRPVAAGRREPWRRDRGVRGSSSWLSGNFLPFPLRLSRQGGCEPRDVTGNGPRVRALHAHLACRFRSLSRTKGHLFRAHLFFLSLLWLPGLSLHGWLPVSVLRDAGPRLRAARLELGCRGGEGLMRDFGAAF